MRLSTLPALALTLPVFLTTDGERNIKLNDALAPSPTGSVRTARVTPDSQRVIYSIERLLFMVPADGSASPIQLTPDPIVPYTSVTSVADYPLTPDGSRVVFRSRPNGSGWAELFSVPVDGSAAPVRLNGPLVPGGEVQADLNRSPAAISPDGTWVVYRADAESNGVVEVFSVPVDGSLPPVKLNPDYVDIEDVSSMRISSDSSFVVYLANQDLNFKDELYRVPIDGSATSVRVSGDLVAGGSVYPDFVLAPDSSFVVYRADQDSNNVIEAYSVPLDGSQASVRLNANMASGEDVVELVLSPTGQRVAITTREPTGPPVGTDRYRLWSRQSQAATAPILLNTGSSGSPRAEFTPDGFRILYLNGSDFLQSVRATGVGGPVTISTDTYSWKVTADSARVLYTDYNASQYRLLSRTVNASQGPIQLNSGGLGASRSWDLSEDGTLAVFVTEEEGREVTHVAPADGSGAALSVREGGVSEFLVTPDNSRLVLRDVTRIEFLTELFSVPTDASLPTVRLSEPLGQGTSAAVVDAQLSPDGQYVVYLGPGEEAGTNELYSVPPDRSSSPVRLNSTPVALGGILEFAISPDSASVVYRGDQDTEGVVELYSVPIDGSAPPTTISDSLDPACTVCLVAGFWITSDGGHVVYRAAQDPPHVFELYGVPLDGSSASVRLNQDIPEDVQITNDSLVTPDGSRVVYRFDPASGPDELYSVPVTGGVPARLDVPDIAHRGTRQFQVSGDSNRVVFTASRDFSQGIDGDLYTAPIDGSALAAKIGGAFDNSNSVDRFTIAPDSSVVVFSLDEDVGGDAILSTALDGSRGAVVLQASVPENGRLDGIEISPDSALLAFTQYVDGSRQLLSVPIDGSSDPVILNPELPQFAGVRTFHFAPDSSRIAYLSDQEVQGVPGIHSVPATGGATRRVSGDLATFNSQVTISPDSRYVVFSDTVDGTTPEILYAGRLEGWFGAARTVPLFESTVHRGELGQGPALVTPDSRRVVYVAEQEARDVFEVFSTFVAPEIESLGPGSGPAGGGNVVTLSGAGFMPETEVFFAGKPGLVTYVSASELWVVVPENLRIPPPTRGAASGKARGVTLNGLEVDVRVETAGIGMTLPDAYTYVPAF